MRERRTLTPSQLKKNDMKVVLTWVIPQFIQVHDHIFHVLGDTCVIWIKGYEYFHFTSCAGDFHIRCWRRTRRGYIYFSWHDTPPGLMRLKGISGRGWQHHCYPRRQEDSSLNPLLHFPSIKRQTQSLAQKTLTRQQGFPDILSDIIWRNC